MGTQRCRAAQTISGEKQPQRARGMPGTPACRGSSTHLWIVRVGKDGDDGVKQLNIDGAGREEGLHRSCC